MAVLTHAGSGLGLLDAAAGVVVGVLLVLAYYLFLRFYVGNGGSEGI